MPKVRIKVSREDKDGVHRSFVLINDRVLPFQNGNEIYVFVYTDREYELHVHCVGARGASTTVTLERAGGKIVDPLKAIINNDLGVSHARDTFEIES